MQEKRCSGCKETKPLNNFYKNKLVLDGHSNYCTCCTRENSKRYFQRKKERELKDSTDNLMKMALLNSYSSDTESTNNSNVNADNLMKILVIEKMCKSILSELESLKHSYIKSESSISI